MEKQHGRVWLSGLLRPQVLGVDPRSAGAGEIEMEALRKRRVDPVGHPLDGGINSAHLRQRRVPVLFHIRRPRIAPLVLFEL